MQQKSCYYFRHTMHAKRKATFFKYSAIVYIANACCETVHGVSSLKTLCNIYTRNTLNKKIFSFFNTMYYFIQETHVVRISMNVKRITHVYMEIVQTKLGHMNVIVKMVTKVSNTEVLWPRPV